MHPRVWFRSTYNPPARRRRVAIRLGASAFAFTLQLGAAVAQNAPSSQPPVTFSDPVAAALCLGGESCTGPASPVPGPFESAPAKDASPAVQGPVCAAEETLKKAPAALKSEALAFSRSDIVARCRLAAIAAAPERAKLEAIKRNRPLILLDEFYPHAEDFFAACYTPRKILNRGPITPAERSYLRQHTGLIIQWINSDWAGPNPVCEAARLGRLVVTAAHCISAGARERAQPGGFIDEIGFRFFDRPTVYGLAWRDLGTKADPIKDPSLDFAVLDIVGAPELDEVVEPQIGAMQLFDDFIVATTSTGMRTARGLDRGVVLDLNSVVLLRSNTLCRPAHITADGIFLHPCYAEGIFSDGAPMFQRQRGQLVFVGLQTGKTDSLQNPSLAACMRGLPNYGVVFRPNTLTRHLFP